MSILGTRLDKLGTAELQKHFEQRTREINFHETVQDQLMFNPAHCILPESIWTPH